MEEGRDYGTEHVIAELGGESGELEVCVLKDSGHRRVHRIEPILDSIQNNLFTGLVLGRRISIKFLLDFIFCSTLTAAASETFWLSPHRTESEFIEGSGFVGGLLFRRNFKMFENKGEHHPVILPLKQSP